MIGSRSIANLITEYKEIQQRNTSRPENERLLPPSTEQSIEGKTASVFAKNQECITSDYAKWLSNTREYLIQNRSDLRALSEGLYPGDENNTDRKNFITLMKYIY